MLEIQFESINKIRKKNRLMDLFEIIELGKRNIIYDPFSLLISDNVEIGSGNVFYPCISIFCKKHTKVMIQNENVFYNNTYLESSTGHIMIGSRNQFGIGQVIVKSNHKDAEIIIGDEGRYVGNISIFGKTTLGSGSQILGDITLNQCELESGESYLCGNPNKRGAVIKGFGTAKNIKVVSGFVVKGDGIFESSNMEPQINYHVEDNL